MTANQINARRNIEEARAHKAQESLKAQELEQAMKELLHEKDKLAETKRHNQYQEKLGVAQTIVGGVSDLASLASGAGSILKGVGSLKHSKGRNYSKKGGK